MDIAKRTLTTTEESVLKNDLMDALIVFIFSNVYGLRIHTVQLLVL